LDGFPELARHRVSGHGGWALLFPVAFLLWLLNHPYQGIWHDAQIYGLVAAHWLHPQGLANDLFFRFGSQGDFSIFTPLYGYLVDQLGLDRAARFVVLFGGVLWVTALLLLARAALGETLAGRFAVLFGVTLTLNYSPNMGVFMLNESFATARSWAFPLGLLAIALLCMRRTTIATGLAVLSCALHPLLGIWSLALVASSRLRTRAVLMLMLSAVLAVLVVGAVDVSIPRLRLLSGDLWRFVRDVAKDIVFKSPENTRLPDYLGWIACLLAGARLGSASMRPLYARLLMLSVTGLLLALVCSYWFPVEIVVQSQPWRVFWLVIPLAGIALLDSGQELCRKSSAVPLYIGILGAAATLEPALLKPLVWALCGASFVPARYLGRLDALLVDRRRWLIAAMAMLWLMALPGLWLTVTMHGERLLNPWWSGTSWLHGLVAGATWPLPLLLAWLTGFRISGLRRYALALVATILIVLALGHWDRRPEPLKMEESRYLAAPTVAHPFGAFVRAGEVVYWPAGELTAWFELHTASYYGRNESTGVVFSHDKFAEWQRRTRQIEGVTDPRQICTPGGVDWVVSSVPIPAAEPLAIHRGARLYSCAMLRAVSPAPTFVGATVK
jgi:hypothetical protein